MTAQMRGWTTSVSTQSIGKHSMFNWFVHFNGSDQKMILKLGQFLIIWITE